MAPVQYRMAGITAWARRSTGSEFATMPIGLSTTNWAARRKPVARWRRGRESGRRDGEPRAASRPLSSKSGEEPSGKLYDECGSLGQKTA